jgi:hypothetical protein
MSPVGRGCALRAFEMSLEAGVAVDDGQAGVMDQGEDASEVSGHVPEGGGCRQVVSLPGALPRALSTSSPAYYSAGSSPVTLR